MAKRSFSFFTAMASSAVFLTMPLFAQGLASPAPASPPTAVETPKVFPPVPPDPIERPEFRSKPHPIVKSLTSATAMMVREERDGGMIGVTSDVIAAVPAESRQGNTFTAVFISKDSGQADVGKEMQTSFEEAVRAVKQRYPNWEAGKIEFSFGEKYTPHDGGSAGTCFATMLLSMLEGFDIDGKCAVTGDISVNWKVRKIGGVAAKVRGAAADHCLYTGIPIDNVPQLSDMAIMYGVSSLSDIQIFSIESLQDAVALLRTDRAPALLEAMKEFAALQPKIKAGGRAALNNPETQRSLQQILTYAPNHESAKLLLDIGRGTASKMLSPTFALYQITVATYPYRDIILGKQPVNRGTVTTAMTQAANKQLSQIRPFTPTEMQELLKDSTAIVNTCESIAQGQSTAATVKTLNTWRQTFVTQIEALGSNKELMEKMVREGY